MLIVMFTDSEFEFYKFYKILKIHEFLRILKLVAARGFPAPGA